LVYFTFDIFFYKIVHHGERYGIFLLPRQSNFHPSIAPERRIRIVPGLAFAGFAMARNPSGSTGLVLRVIQITCREAAVF
jgi:hypothetical protein